MSEAAVFDRVVDDVGDDPAQCEPVAQNDGVLDHALQCHIRGFALGSPVVGLGANQGGEFDHLLRQPTAASAARQ
jgi:hypothetical protein